MIPWLLSFSKQINTSVSIAPISSGNDPVLNSRPVMTDLSICKAAAETCLELSKTEGADGLANFRFCVSFNVPSNIPFFPAAFHASGASPTLTVGLESADLLFLGLYGVEDNGVAVANLRSVLSQALLPIEELVRSFCADATKDLTYGGIDASINPGLTPQDSVGAGLENLWPHHFGKLGSMAAVSVVTAAIKSLGEGEGSIQLAGYSGLMLPVMEDLVLAARATEEAPGGFSVRDLLALSSVCGVGIDTVPIPGDSTAEALAGLYWETGALAFRLAKPLTCRVLPIPGKVAGQMTSVDSPYLVNCPVFSIE